MFTKADIEEIRDEAHRIQPKDSQLCDWTRDVARVAAEKLEAESVAPTGYEGRVGREDD